MASAAGHIPAGGAAAATTYRRVAVYVIEARTLSAMDVAGASDPYCKLALGPMALETEVVPNTTNPAWHEALFFALPVVGAGGQVSRDDLLLAVDVLDSDAYKWDDPLGAASVDIAAVRVGVWVCVCVCVCSVWCVCVCVCRVCVCGNPQ